MIRHLVLLLVAGFISNIAFAQSYIGPQASGMGGAGRSAIVPGESAFLNPATIPFFGEYFATGFYSQGSHPVSGDGQQYGVLLSDGYSDRLFQGALGYVHSNLSPIGGTDVTNQDIYVAASGLMTKNISFGLDAHRFMYQASGQGETYQYNGGAGLIYAFSKNLFFGLVASDLLKAKEDIPVVARLNRTYAASATYSFEQIMNARLDLVRPTDLNPDHKTDVMTGVESEIAQYMAFRTGFRWNESGGPERRVFTLGTGFKGPKLRADYSFEKDTKVAGGTRHSFDLWMSF